MPALLATTPTYDMLPMLYAPVAREFAAGRLQPTTATLPEWERAKALAVVFWALVAGDARISDGFRAIAAVNLKEIGL